MLPKENYFPRGHQKFVTSSKENLRTKNKKNSKSVPNQPFSLKKLTTTTTEKKKKRRWWFNTEESTTDTIQKPQIPRLKTVTQIDYACLQEGFIVAGCVSAIRRTRLVVNLPGRLMANVKINKISAPYNELLSLFSTNTVSVEAVPTLCKLFEVGEMVTCMVDAVKKRVDGYDVELSLNPMDVNRDKTVTGLEKYMVLVGAIKHVEDHGYMIDIGIENVNAFLPTREINTYLQEHEIQRLHIGKVIKVVVMKVFGISEGKTTVMLTPYTTNSKIYPQIGYNVGNITPGQAMEVYVKKSVSNGIEVIPIHSKEKINGYVHTSHIPDALKLEPLTPGTAFSATLLYTLAPVSILFFSLKSYSENDNISILKLKSIIHDAEVAELVKNRAYLNLDSESSIKGVVSIENSSKPLCIGETCAVRVLFYDYFDKIYECSLIHPDDIISEESKLIKKASKKSVVSETNKNNKKLSIQDSLNCNEFSQDNVKNNKKVKNSENKCNPIISVDQSENHDDCNDSLNESQKKKSGKSKSPLVQGENNYELDLSEVNDTLNESLKKKSKKRKNSLIENENIDEFDSSEINDCLNESQGKKSRKRKNSLIQNENKDELDSSEVNISLDESQGKKNKKRKNSLQQNESKDEFDCSEVNSNLNESRGKKNKKQKNSLEQNENKEDELDSSEINSNLNESQGKKLEKRKKTSLLGKEKLDQDELITCINSQETQNHLQKNHEKEVEKCRLSLNGAGNFFWNIDAKSFTALSYDEKEVDCENDDDDEEELQNRRPKTAAERKIAAKETEKRLMEVEKQLLEAETNPQSVDHFERLTLAQPNNSFIWIKYMAYHLQATEIEKARVVASRALKRIGHREEQDRINVWVALLNLENLYGCEESLRKTVDEAVRNCDEYQIYSKLAEIYVDSKKATELDKVVSRMVRKFADNLECWLLCCRCLLKLGMADKARSTFQRGIKQFPKKKHVQYITRFALMENEHGSSEQAQTLFEHILTTYTNNLPTWIVYVDMLVKSGQIELARNVLERATVQKFKVKQMKTLFTKWLAFEQKYGNETNRNHVQKAAENYANSLKSSIDND